MGIKINIIDENQPVDKTVLEEGKYLSQFIDVEEFHACKAKFFKLHFKILSGRFYGSGESAVGHIYLHLFPQLVLVNGKNLFMLNQLIGEETKRNTQVDIEPYIGCYYEIEMEIISLTKPNGVRLYNKINNIVKKY